MLSSPDPIVPDITLCSKADLGVASEDVKAYPRLRAAYAESSRGESFEVVMSAFLVPEDVLIRHILEEHISFEVLQILGPPVFDIQACAYRGFDLTCLADLLSERFLSSSNSHYQALLAKTLNHICAHQSDVRSNLSDKSLVDALARNPSGPFDSGDMGFPACRMLYEQLLQQIGGIPE